MKSIDDNGSMEQRRNDMTEDEMFYEVLHHYDNMNIALAVLPDCYITRFYDFMIKLASAESSKSEKKGTAKLQKIKDMIASLEQVPAIQDHILEKTKEQNEIDEIVALIEERQKVHKMGPIRKYVYMKRKKNRTI